jgi:hypothetical protein
VLQPGDRARRLTPGPPFLPSSPSLASGIDAGPCVPQVDSVVPVRTRLNSHSDSAQSNTAPLQSPAQPANAWARTRFWNTTYSSQRKRPSHSPSSSGLCCFESEGTREMRLVLKPQTTNRRLKGGVGGVVDFSHNNGHTHPHTLQCIPRYMTAWNTPVALGNLGLSGLAGCHYHCQLSREWFTV